MLEQNDVQHDKYIMPIVLPIAELLMLLLPQILPWLCYDCSGYCTSVRVEVYYVKAVQIARYDC